MPALSLGTRAQDLVDADGGSQVGLISQSLPVLPTSRAELSATPVVRPDPGGVRVSSGKVTTARGKGEDRSVWTAILPVDTTADAPVAIGDTSGGLQPPTDMRASARGLAADMESLRRRR